MVQITSILLAACVLVSASASPARHIAARTPLNQVENVQTLRKCQHVHAFVQLTDWVTTERRGFAMEDPEPNRADLARREFAMEDPEPNKADLAKRDFAMEDPEPNKADLAERDFAMEDPEPSKADLAGRSL
ncbi:hypothetical protein B0H13DRAFT_1891062 [Mycena leptocephala]|nr:hypothetical protein B0H13DRAFT_1891062 [Mycena leptocephala]